MRLLASTVRVCSTMLLAFVATAALAADFTQPERTPDFIKSCRRQDRELKAYFNERFPDSFAFSHYGSFRALVHRDGLSRSAVLVPVQNLPYATGDALRGAARKKPVVVGALKLTYGQADPFVHPGDMLLLYDEQHVHIYNSEGLEVNRFLATLGVAPLDAPLDPAVGAVATSATSLAQLQPDGTLQLYLQLANSKGEALKEGGAYQKLLLSFMIPGLLTDDSSPVRELATPQAEEDS